MTIINPPAQSSKLVYEFAYREPVRWCQLVLSLTVNDVINSRTFL